LEAVAVKVAVGEGVLVRVDVDVAVKVGVAVLVFVAVAVPVAVGVRGSPKLIVTTKPLAVAESIDTETPLAPSMKLSPTSQRAPESPVLPFPSASTT
jgi:hypothetical protein